MADRFIKISTEIMKNANLSSGAKLLFGLILSLSKKETYCYSNNDYLANEMKTSSRTITRYLNELISENLIECKYQSGNKRKIFIIKQKT